MGIGRLKASIPMKCMDQMPMPIENAPPISQSWAERPLEAVMRVARSSAVYDAKIATMIESSTSQ